MAAFEYDAAAELFPGRPHMSKRRTVSYRRFARAAEAIKFAIEELPAEFLAGAWLVVDEERFEASQIRNLYNHPEYPLKREGVPAVLRRVSGSKPSA